MFSRLCGSIGHWASYSINGKEFLCWFFHFVHVDMPALFERRNWKLLPKVNFIYV